MTRTTVTLDLPSDIYDGLQRRALEHQHRLEDEVGLALAAAVGTLYALPDDLEAMLDVLATLEDDTLQRLSYSQPTVEDGLLLDALLETRSRRVLTPSEEVWLVELGERHDRVMGLRARAVALLHQRGVDVSERVARA